MSSTSVFGSTQPNHLCAMALETSEIRSNGAGGGLFSADTGVGLTATSNSSHAAYARNGAGSGLQPLFGYGTGVWGDSDNGNGVVGTSYTGFGVYGALAPITGVS